MLASEAGLPVANHATAVDEGPGDGSGASSGSDDDGDDPPAAQRSQRARAVVAAAQAVPEEPQPSGRFKQSGFYIPHARYVQHLIKEPPALGVCGRNSLCKSAATGKCLFPRQCSWAADSVRSFACDAGRTGGTRQGTLSMGLVARAAAWTLR